MLLLKAFHGKVLSGAAEMLLIPGKLLYDTVVYARICRNDTVFVYP